jgi:hypothetical protein
MSEVMGWFLMLDVGWKKVWTSGWPDPLFRGMAVRMRREREASGGRR